MLNVDERCVMNGTEEEEGGIIAQAPHDVNQEKCVEIMQRDRGVGVGRGS